MSAVAAVRDASWRERAATVAVFLALGIEVGTWAAAVPALKSELGLDAGRLSLVLLTLPIGSVISTVAMGVIAPRFDSGPLAGLAALATVVGFGLPGLAGTFSELLACGTALGLTAGALEVAINGHASDVERRWGTAIMSSFHAAFSVGGLLGACLGGLSAAAGVGLRGQLWMPLVLAVLLVLTAFPALGRGARGEAHGLGLGRPTRGMLVLGFVAMGSYLLEGAMADWSAVYMTGVAAASAGAAAMGYAAFSVTMAIGRVTGDVVVNHLGARRVLMLGGLLAAVGFAIAVAVPSPAMAGIGFALVGAGAANVVPVVFSAAGRIGTNPASGIALVSTFGFAGFLGGPPLIGAIATWAGLRVAIGCLVIVALLVSMGGLMVATAAQRRRSRT